MVDHIVTRALDQFRLHSGTTKRWDGHLEHSSGRTSDTNNIEEIR